MWKSDRNREEGPGRHCKPHRSRDMSCLRTQVPKNLPFCMEQSEETEARESRHGSSPTKVNVHMGNKGCQDPPALPLPTPLISVPNWLSDQCDSEGSTENEKGGDRMSQAYDLLRREKQLLARNQRSRKQSPGKVMLFEDTD